MKYIKPITTITKLNLNTPIMWGEMVGTSGQNQWIDAKKNDYFDEEEIQESSPWDISSFD